MTAAPRFWHCGTNVFSSQVRSVMTSVAGLPLILALVKSGYCVLLWLPQMVTQVTSSLATPAFFARACDGAVVVEPRHGGPALGGDVAAVAVGDQAVGVARIADDQDAHVLRRVGRQRLALADEDLAVDAEQVLALHALLAREASRPAGPSCSPLNALFGIVGHDDVLQRREAAIVQLHGHAFERRHAPGGISSSCRMTLRVRAEDLAGGQPGQHGVGHLPGRPGHRHANRVCHGSALSFQRSADQPDAGPPRLSTVALPSYRL